MCGVSSSSEKDITISNITLSTASYVSKKVGSKLGKLPVPKRTGYNFLGWYTAPSGGKKVTSNTKVTSNMKLYSRWKEKEVHIYYTHGDGSVGNDYVKNAGFISNSTDKILYQIVKYGTTKDPYNYTSFGLEKAGYTSPKGSEWCTSDKKICFNQNKKYSYDTYVKYGIDVDDYTALFLEPNWK